MIFLSGEAFTYSFFQVVQEGPKKYPTPQKKSCFFMKPKLQEQKVGHRMYVYIYIYKSIIKVAGAV